MQQQQPDGCAPEIRRWLESAGLRVKPFYRVSELALLLEIPQKHAKRYARSGAIDVVSYSDRLPGSHIFRVTWAGIEQLASERGLPT